VAINLQAAETIKLRVAGTAPSGHFSYVTAEELGKILNQKTGINVDVIILADATLGGDLEITRGIQNGSIDAGFTPGFSVTNITGVKEFQIPELPFLFPNKQIAYKVLDEVLAPQLFPKMQNAGIMAWAFWDLGYRHMTSNNRPIVDPKDLKGMKMRIPQLPMFVDMFQCWGVNPVPISRGELYSALQQGVLDGQENPLGIIYNGKLQEVQNTVSLTGHSEMQYIFMMSKKFYDGLPAKIKDVLPGTVVDLLKLNRQMSDQDDVELIKKLKNEKVNVVELTLAQKQTFKDAAKTVYDKWEKEINSPLFKQVLDAVNSEIKK